VLIILLFSLLLVSGILGYLYWQKNIIVPVTYVNSVVTLDSPFKIEGLKPSDKIYKWENEIGRNGYGGGDGDKLKGSIRIY
jgi:hypothetical protein